MTRLIHELCEACGCPSWDAFPLGVLAHWWTCQRCGHKHKPYRNDETYREDAREEAKA